MKQFFSVFLLALVGTAQAQRQCLKKFEAIPACAFGYYVSAASSIGGCGLDDFRCQCSNSAAIQSQIQQPVLSQCGNMAVDVINSVGQECSCVSKNPRKTLSPNAVAKRCSASALAIPPCAQGYYSSAGLSIGGCDYDDFRCQCSNSASVQSNIQATILSQCGREAVEALQSASALCACATGKAARDVEAGPITAA